MRSSLTDASDAAIVVAIGRWREDALAEAYRRHAGAVYGLARRVTNDAGLAEEVTQEVYLRLWNSPDKFDPDRGSLRSFLLSQAHGRSVDMVRSETSRRRREETDARRTTPAGHDVERDVLEHSVSDQVKQAVAQLPDDEKRAIELAYFGGHTYREVASMLNQPEGTVKSRIRSGMRRLGSELAAAGLSSGGADR